MKNFRTFNLAVAFYQEATAMPLPRHLSDQFKRAASSIVLNLAEGAARETPVDQRRFYRIAYGSLRECQAILTLVKHTHLLNQLDSIAAHLYKLIQSRWG